MRRVLAAALFVVCAAAGFFPARAQPAACVGTDLLDELARTDPALWRAVQEESAEVKNANARLWRISRPGAPDSFLLGTVHSTDPRITTLSPAVEAAIEASDTIALEIADLSPDAMVAVLKSDPDLIIYTDGREIGQQLKPAELATVNARLRAAGMVPELIALMRPWFAYTLLSLPDCERERKTAGLKVLDMILADEGRRRGRTVVGLESVKEQLSALAGITETEQIALLRVAIAWSPRAADMLESVQQRYLRREIAATWPLHKVLAAKVGYAAEGFRSFQGKVLIERNGLMRDRSLALLDRGRALIAVGAMHLVGERGLVALYRESGFTVEPIE